MIELDLNAVTKKLKGNVVLDHVSMHLEGGHIYGLRGQNGCGKTMLMRAVCGLIIPSSGEIKINGKVLNKDISFPESIGALIENPSFIKEYTGRKNLEMLAELSGLKNIEKIVNSALEQTGLLADADKKYGRYSLGMKQKLGIAYAVMGEPDIIVLDEPINALDEKSVDNTKKLLVSLKEKGKLIIVACHDREELDFLADKIYMMETGKILTEKE